MSSVGHFSFSGKTLLHGVIGGSEGSVSRSDCSDLTEEASGIH
jgi:hypothetical protein